MARFVWRGTWRGVAMSLAGVAWLVVGGLVVGGCDEGGEDKPDAVTGATYKVDKNPTLPPKADGYEVVGKVDGLNKYVVKYSDKLYRGGQPVSGKGMKQLKKWGVKTILSVTPDDIERKYAKEGGFELVEVPFENGTPIPAETVAKFLAACKDKPGPYYLHCMGGTHRAGALGLAYRVHIEGWDYDKALIEFGRLGGDLKKDFQIAESVRKP